MLIWFRQQILWPLKKRGFASSMEGHIANNLPFYSFNIIVSKNRFEHFHIERHRGCLLVVLSMEYMIYSLLLFLYISDLWPGLRLLGFFPPDLGFWVFILRICWNLGFFQLENVKSAVTSLWNLWDKFRRI